MKRNLVFILVFCLSILCTPFELNAQPNVSYSIEVGAVSYNISNYGFLVEPWVYYGHFSFGIGTKYKVAPPIRTIYSNPHGSFAVAKAHNLAFSIDAQYHIPSTSSWRVSFRAGFTFLNLMLSHSEIENSVVTENFGTRMDDPYVTIGTIVSKRFGNNFSIGLMPFFNYYFTRTMAVTRADLGFQIGFKYRFK